MHIFFPERGNKKFWDKCNSTQECGFEGSVCDDLSGRCVCHHDLPVTNHLDKCGVGKFIITIFKDNFKNQ